MKYYGFGFVSSMSVSTVGELKKRTCEFGAYRYPILIRLLCLEKMVEVNKAFLSRFVINKAKPVTPSTSEILAGLVFGWPMEQLAVKYPDPTARQNPDDFLV